ncbi:MAG: glycogen synthase [Candidatus Nanopelagicales bacterium]|nr:glycogen synthase [Candidatus Nanopelagicales bacterium]
MRIALLTKEWPPQIYGGAGVHVQYLVPALAAQITVDVHAFGTSYTDARAHATPQFLEGTNPALETLGVNLDMVRSISQSKIDLIHSHTWYSNFAGQSAALLQDVPLVVTAHSLEPMRPWKEEQLGGGYRVSSWIEKSAYEGAAAIIAVSQGVKADVLTCYPNVSPQNVHVIHNGIDTDIYRPDPSFRAIEKYSIDLQKPYSLFVGRITRQKGLTHLLKAAKNFDPHIQVVLCASAPDTPEIAAEVDQLVAELRALRGPENIIWITKEVPRDELIQLLTHASVFTCPSIYEPQGIVNLEAMACETAVVASDVGGIPEVVTDGVTGVLVHYEPDEPYECEKKFAEQVNRVVADANLQHRLGIEGRKRAISHFAWDAIAESTINLYQSVLR